MGDTIADTGAIPCVADQRKIIKDVISGEKLNVNEEAYLVSTLWYQNWQSYIRWSETVDEGQNPGPIDNSDILGSDESILPTKSEGRDFLVITKKEWEYLYKWYGGGPKKAVPVVLDPYYKKEMAVLKTMCIKVYYLNEKATFVTHAFETIKSIRTRSLNHFKLPQDTVSRMVCYMNQHVSGALNEEFTLQVSLINDGSYLLLDTLNKDKEWMSSKLQKVSKSTITCIPGKCGLQNLGNTCYFNSGVQCLLHTLPLVKLLFQKDLSRMINKKNPIGSKGVLFSAFQDLLNQVWLGKERVISPSALKMRIGQYSSRFNGWSQQDSHELISFLLDGIHEDLNQSQKNETFENQHGDGSNDEEIARLSWNNYLKRNRSIIVDLFQGQLKSTLDCPRCEKRTVVFDPFMTLTLPITMPHNKGFQIRYVPFDINMESQVYEVSISGALSIEKVRAALKEKINNDHDIVFFTRGSMKLDYGLSISEGSQSFDYIACEVLGDDPFYVPVTFRAKVTYEYWNSPRDFSGPFLLPLPSNHPTNDEIHNAIEQRFSALWAMPCPPQNLSKELQDKHSAIRGSNGVFKENERYTYIIDTEYYSGMVKQNCFIPSTNPKFSKNKIIISPDVNNPDLNWKILLLNDKPSKEKNDRPCSLYDCFEYFREIDVLDDKNQWFCPHCRQHVCAQKAMSLYSVPQVLVIHLKRFDQKGYYVSKNSRKIDFPDVIDISEYIAGPKSGLTGKYQLYAVSEHMGGMGGGHYTAHALVTHPEQNTGEWYSFNDSSVSAAKSIDSHTSNAYVLFYQRMDSECPIVTE